MAENKKSFVLYCDLIHTVKKLPKEKQAELFVHILEYVNDENPETDDVLLEIAFEPIKQSLKRDLKKYESKLEKKSIGARIGNLKRWHNEIYLKYHNQEISLDTAEKIAYQSQSSDSDKNIANIADSVSVSDSVNDSVSDILLKKETKEKKFNFKSSLLNLKIEKKIIDEWLLIRKKKKLVNTETAFDRIKIEIEKTNLSASECIKIAVENSWAGFKKAWLDNISAESVTNNSNYTPIER